MCMCNMYGVNILMGQKDDLKYVRLLLSFFFFLKKGHKMQYLLVYIVTCFSFSLWRSMQNEMLNHILISIQGKFLHSLEETTRGKISNLTLKRCWNLEHELKFSLHSAWCWYWFEKLCFAINFIEFSLAIIKFFDCSPLFQLISCLFTSKLDFFHKLSHTHTSTARLHIYY